MASNAVIERRNKQIQDAIDGQNLKQALQLCEKRLKKGEDSSFLKAWKANILFSHADEAHRQRGVAETLQLCSASPPVSDLEALNILHNTLNEIGGHEETARALWQNAAKAKPQDLEIQLRWFRVASDAGDWKTAQKAAMSLQNNFPKARNYYFWAIFMCYLIERDTASSDNDRKLFGTLAYRMISKAAGSVPTDPKELLSIPRAIQTAEELYLLIKIYESQSRHKELVEILDSEHLGVGSRIAQNEWLFFTNKLSVIENSGLWDQALKFTKELLTLDESVTAESKPDAKYEERDDWKVWNLLLLATRKAEKQDAFQDTAEVISNYLEKRPASRNAQLANLELKLQGIEMDKSDPEEVLRGCIEYFRRNQRKIYCFNDLQRYLTGLDTRLYSKFEDEVSKIVEETKKSSAIPQINAYKLEYSFRLKFENTKDAIIKTESFVCRCLHDFKDAGRADAGDTPSTIEAEPTDDLCLLAAMALIRLHDAIAGSTTNYVLVQAAGILEHLLLKSPHNYEALLLLVRIYLLLGAGSLALKKFSKLSVKQIQYETVAHNLFTRLATIHPQSAPPSLDLDRKDYDPQAGLRQALLFYRNAESATTYSLSTGLDNGSYINVEGSIELRNDLKNSLCRKMWALEARRLHRIVGGPSISQYDKIVLNNSPLSDKRNFEGFMNCEPRGKPAFEEYVRIGPFQKTQAINALAVSDALFTCLTAVSPKASKPKLSPYLEFDVNSAGNELTSAEKMNIQVHHLLLKCLAVFTGESPSDAATVDNTLSKVGAYLEERLKVLVTPDSKTSGTIDLTPNSNSASPAPSWIFLHEAILLLETLKAILLFISFINKNKSYTSGDGKAKINALKDRVKAVADEVRAQCQGLKIRISSSGMLGHLVDIVHMRPGGLTGTEDVESALTLDAEIEALMDSASLELFCGSLMESWEDALDGVISICSTVR
ncbi:N-alpha-acetyltransferase NatB auxiliary subunit [Trichophyton mentagrophytes]|nr:N-alpha-acetyltransferase NatB auxiliary subunit [Trichophyton mentagrophytes]